MFPLVKAFDNYNDEHCNTFQFSHEVDPCDPTVARHTTSQHSKSQQRGDNKNQGKNKIGKGKGKGKKIAEDERPTKPVRKLWYEALSPEGYTYYWHIETNGEYICVLILKKFSFLPFFSAYLLNNSLFLSSVVL